MTGFQTLLQRLFIGLMGLCCALPFAVHAEQYMTQSAWLEDASASLTFAQVEKRARAFQPYTGVLTKGYTASATWIRLSIAATSSDQLVLRIRPSFLDHVELYDPVMQPESRTTPRFSGDLYPSVKIDYYSLNHGFTIPGSRHARDVYLMLKSTSTMLVFVEVLDVAEAKSADHRQELLYSMYVGLLMAFAIWALLQWLSSREPLIAAFLFKQTIVLVHALAFLGYLPLLFDGWLSPSTMNSMTSVLVLSYVFVGAGFLFLLLREFNPVRWLWWLFVAVLFLYLPIAILFVLGHARLALQINAAIAIVEAVGIFVVTLSTRVPDDKHPLPLPRLILVCFSSVLLLTAFISTLSSLGGIAPAEWSLNSGTYAGFVSSLLMIAMLSLRARNLEKNRQQSLLERDLAAREAEVEKRRREEQERFLGMLTHELKTPLGVARISLGASKLTGLQRDRIDRALTNINAIIDRCCMTDQLEHQRVLRLDEECDMVSLVDECIACCIDPERIQVVERHPIRMHSDSQLLVICLANLVDNALKYSPSKTPVTVRILRQPCAAGEQHDEQYVGAIVTVTNVVGSTGVPDPARIFSKYYRNPRALSKSGSGLGLYLTSSIARLLDAQVSYRCEGEQVEFRLEVPV
jgi:signal transduction histidine kinase